MSVLVIGLPMSGKTFFINNLLQRDPRPLDHYMFELIRIARKAKIQYNYDPIIDEFLDNPSIFTNFTDLWQTPSMQFVWRNRNQLTGLCGISDQLDYIMPRIDRIRAGRETRADRLYGYSPTMFPCTYTWNRTAWRESRTVIPSERAYFCCALTDYNLVCEDGFTPRMQASMDLLRETRQHIQNITIILTKKDLFVKKIYQVPFKLPGVRNSEYYGPMPEEMTGHEVDAMIDYVKHHYFIKDRVVVI